MSLFTFKEILSIDGGEGFSSFSSKSLVAANVDNGDDENIKLVVGSFTGLLRIIGQKASNNQTDQSNDQPEATILAELHLGHPILQVEADVFIGGSEDLNLAILHPFKLAVYTVSKLQGQVEHGSQYKVTLVYEHLLKRHGFNMCCGPFGHGLSETKKSRKSGRRFICVQSLDGTLSFFEQELFTFCRYLPGFLLPSPIAYIQAWDSFLTMTSWNLVCFKYTSLAMAKDDPYQQQSQDTTVGKRLTPDWQFSIGEDCIGDIQVLSTKDPSTSSVIVCTFRNILCFGDGGHLLWSKRLDFQISYFCSYAVPFSETEHECITIAASHNEPHILYVYSGTTLRWAAKFPFAPVHLSKIKSDNKNAKGCIAGLSCDGKVVMGCLGTVPSLFVAPPVQARDLDYEAAEKELNDLRKAINAAGEQEVSANKDSTVEVKLEFEGQKTKWIESNGAEVMSLIGVLKIVCHLRVNDVRVTFNTPKPIVCSPDSVLIGDIIGRHSYPVEFYVDSEAIPSDLQCDIFVFYLHDNGTPHFIQKCGIRIPLFIVAKPHHKLEKDGDVKLTFSVNKPAIALPSIYSDFQWNLEGTVPGISFLLHGGESVSILTSTKNAASDSSKYRIQSHNLAGVYIIFRDFIDRLHRRFGREKPDLIIEPLGFDEEISLLTDYFREIDAHALQRKRDIQIKEDLSDRAAQLRAIQRRLLIRFRDKNPLPLTQLEILFEGSLDQVGDCLNFMEGNGMEMQKTECRLSGATKLLVELISLKHKEKLDTSLLLSALSPDMWNFSEEYGWEECVYTALTYMKSGLIVNQSLANLDLSKLKKAVKSAVEKAWKESKTDEGISEKVVSTGKKEDSKPTTITKESEMLIGNEIQERMTSARGRMTRRMNTTLASIPEPTESEETDLQIRDEDNPDEIPTKLNDWKNGNELIEHQNGENLESDETLKNKESTAKKLNNGLTDLADEGFW